MNKFLKKNVQVKSNDELKGKVAANFNTAKQMLFLKSWSRFSTKYNY